MVFFRPNHKVNPADRHSPVGQTSLSESPPVMANKSFSFKTWFLWVAVVLLMVTPVGLFVFFFSGLVVGEEFSPDDFTRRRFSYNVVPLINYTFQGIEYADTTPVLEKTLVSDGLILTPPGSVGTQKKWHLVSDFKTPVNVSDDFDAGILCQYLDLTNPGGENVWVVWNSKHPQLAVTFWPIVQDLARHQVYWAIPPIMRRALSLEQPNDALFSDYLVDATASAYIQAAQECQNREDHLRAVELFTLSIERRPGATALRGRAESHRLTGNEELGRADERSAKGYE